MKECPTCNRILDESNFYFSGFTKSGTHRIHYECKSCAKERERKRYEEQLAIVNSLKAPCKKCGEDKNYLIEFHHRDPKEKEFVIAHWRKKSWSKFLNELQKCDTLCKNCHAEFHYLQNKFGITYEEFIDPNFQIPEKVA